MHSNSVYVYLASIYVIIGLLGANKFIVWNVFLDVVIWPIKLVWVLICTFLVKQVFKRNN